MNASELKDKGFTESWAVLRGQSFPVFKDGAGPGVVLIHEIPGITAEVAAFARLLVDSGFTVWMPYLFGKDPGPTKRLDGWGPALRACVSGQLVLLGTGRTSPITEWLRALAQALHEERGGPGVGVIGMCFSGGFALATVLEPAVLAPVMSQPALPFALTPSHARAVGLSPSDAITIGRRIDEDGLCVLGLRFTKDRLSPLARFRRLEQMLNGNFLSVQIPSGRGTKFSRWAHSVLTRERSRHAEDPNIEAAVREVLQFLKRRLAGGPAEADPGGAADD
ncbi:MAG TPA: dienelactone hydrolase family protein [Actinomycetota bacterium]